MAIEHPWFRDPLARRLAGGRWGAVRAGDGIRQQQDVVARRADVLIDPFSTGVGVAGAIENRGWR